MSFHHARFMRAALSLSHRHLGQTWPNPSVGALVVKNERILAQGWTGKGGRPHAETEALAAAGKLARGATLYVTLEPCAHRGKTPPCVDAIIKANIACVVIACRDPNPNVEGGGIEKLKSAGIEVVEDVCADEARALHCGFFSLMEKKRPFIALKLATSLDGKITRGKGQSQWITSDPARAYAHLLRSRYDAILTGIGTVLADDPLLTCRLPGLAACSPVRVVLDRHRRFPAQCKLAQSKKDAPVWVLDAPDIPAVLAELAERGITRLLVEGGQKVTTAFLHSGLVDKIYWFRAPVTVGAEGLAAIESDYADALSYAHWRRVERITLSPDNLDVMTPCLQAS